MYQEKLTSANVYSSPLTIKKALIIMCTDIDLCMMFEEDQTTAKDELFTPDQIRDQLKKSLNKMLDVVGKLGLDVDAPIGQSFYSVSLN